MFTALPHPGAAPPPTTLTQRADAIVAAEKVRNIAATLNELARAKKFPATAKARHKAWRELMELAGAQMLASLARAPGPREQDAVPEPWAPPTSTAPDAAPAPAPPTAPATAPPTAPAPAPPTAPATERLTVEKAAPLFTTVRNAVNTANDLPPPPRHASGLPNSMTEP